MSKLVVFFSVLYHLNTAVLSRINNVCYNRTLYNIKLDQTEMNAFINKCNEKTSIDCLHKLQSQSIFEIFGEKPQCFPSNVVANQRLSVNLFHTVWISWLSPPILRLIKSFLYTQNLAISKLIVWTQHSYYHQCLQDFDCDIVMRTLKPFRQFIEIRTFDLQGLVTDSLNLLGNYTTMYSERMVHELLKPSASAQSDFFRMSIVALHGGVYVDADSIFLRDLQPLFSIEFVYKWSVKPPYASKCNTALMHFKKDSAAILNLFKCLTQQLTYHPRAVLPCRDERIVTYFYELPTEAADPLWRSNDFSDMASREQWSAKCGMRKFSDAFVNRNRCSNSVLMHLFDGAFTYHWHNQWQIVPEPDSYLGAWESVYDLFLNGKSRNEFGEYAPRMS